MVTPKVERQELTLSSGSARCLHVSSQPEAVINIEPSHPEHLSTFTTASWGKIGEGEERGRSEELGEEAHGGRVFPCRREEKRGCIRRENGEL